MQEKKKRRAHATNYLIENKNKYILRYPEEDLVKILKDSGYHSEEWEETDPEEEWPITQSAVVEDDEIIEEAIKQKSSSIYIHNKWWRSPALLRLLHDRIDPTVELLKKKPLTLKHKIRTFRHEDEKIEKTDKNKILLLEAQKIASQVYKDGIKEIYKLTVDALKKNDSYETDKYISSLSHISNIITTAAKHQPHQQPQQSQQPPPQPLHQSNDSSKIFCLYCYGPHWLTERALALELFFYNFYQIG
ncbi:unnamed protein product [Rhizophagus irregularis]|nr:unnamed protein product [Rhizophagus irregularis]CAB4390126.1 unnamed protein product [Rhizophagus irregularis]CAB4396056.1 unnamed protein product [Rhizophagus irregularis]CAB4398135.1 unnamed protein product [Rhizophagus irregularis]CAB4400808.1 unnamed protein product [Rhizophagus irregularis]